MSNIKKVVQPINAPTIPERTLAKPTKSEIVLNLMRRDHGATLSELVEATNWQAHTTRAMMTGLRKKGYAIERIKRDGASCYFLSIPDS